MGYRVTTQAAIGCFGLALFTGTASGLLVGEGGGPTFPVSKMALGSSPSELASADFNLDGHADFVTANTSTGDVSIRLGVGNGFFGDELRFTAGTEPRSVVVADFNEDLVPDLAVANRLSNDVSILLGQGDGSFLAGSTLIAGTNPENVRAYDFNGDLHMDLVSVHGNSNDIAVFLGAGDGSFGTGSFFGTGQNPRAVVAGLFDSNGTLDLAVANSTSDDVSILLGDGLGGFGLPTDFPVSGNISFSQLPQSIDAGDLNGDGELDLAVTTRGAPFPGGSLYILLGAGDGSFGTASAQGFADLSVQLVDLTGDSILDALAARSFPGELMLIPGNGDGTFAAGTTLFGGGQTRGVVAADFNLDGVLDVAGSNEASDDLLLYFGRGALEFGTQTIASSIIAQRHIVGQFSASGPLDLVAVDGGLLNRVIAYEGNGDGTFTQSDVQALGATARDVALGDLNQDNIPDLAVTVSGLGIPGNEGHLSVLIGAGDGSFGAPSNFPAGFSPQAVAIGAFNDDAAMDLVAANTDGNLAVVISRGGGDFNAPFLLNSGAGVTDVAGGDFNGDLDTDIVATNSGPGNVSVHINNSRGSFFEPGFESVGSGPASVAVVDLNLDGDLDLAVANQGGSDLSVLLGNGDGSFATALSIPSGEGPGDVVAIDLNLDGKLDLAATNFVSSDVSVHLGLGDGSFESALFYFPGESPRSIGSGDFNGDGTAELSVTTFGELDLVVLENNVFAPLSLCSSRSVASLSAVLPSITTLDLNAGSSNAASIYWVLGSVTGTDVGLDFGGGLVLPLNFDIYTNLTLTKPFSGLFSSFIGILDPDGEAQATINTPGGLDPSLAGITFHHAYMSAAVFGEVDFVSNAVALTMIP